MSELITGHGDNDSIPLGLPRAYVHQALQEIDKVCAAQDDPPLLRDFAELLAMPIDDAVNIPDADYLAKIKDQAALALRHYKSQLSPSTVGLLERLSEAQFSQPNNIGLDDLLRAVDEHSQAHGAAPLANVRESMLHYARAEQDRILSYAHDNKHINLLPLHATIGISDRQRDNALSKDGKTYGFAERVKDDSQSPTTD